MTAGDRDRTRGSAARARPGTPRRRGARALRASSRSELVIVETEGDRRAPDTAWGEGAFVAAIERALLDGRVDVAVHSAKDVPTDEDPRLSDRRLPARGPTRATPSSCGPARRRARSTTCRRARGSAPTARGGPASCSPGGRTSRVHPLHGNVDTRLRRLDAGETDALVLAVAGLDRLGRGDRIAERLEPDARPAGPRAGRDRRPGPGGDDAACSPAAGDDRRSTDAARRRGRAGVPRGVRRRLPGADRRAGDDRRRRDGPARRLRLARTARRQRLARAVRGARRAERGSRAGLATLGRASWTARDRTAAAGRRVLVTRAAEQADELASATPGGRDSIAVSVPAIAVDPVPPGGALDAAARRLDALRAGWSSRARTAHGRSCPRPSASSRRSDAPRWAAIGSATRRVLERRGHRGRPPAEPGERGRASAGGAAGRAGRPGPPRSRRSRRRGAARRAARPRAPRSTTSSPTGRARRPSRLGALLRRGPRRRSDRRGPVHERLDRPRARRARPSGVARRCHLDPGRLHRSRDGRRGAARLGFRVLAEAADAGRRRARRDDRRGARAHSPRRSDDARPRSTARPSPSRAATLPVRPRRLRRTPALRALVRETRLHPSMLVAPLFVRPGAGIREPIGVDARPGPALAGPGRRGGRPAGRAGRRRGHPLRPARGEGRAGERGVGRRRDRPGRVPADPGARAAARDDRRHLPVRVHRPRSLRAAGRATARSTTMRRWRDSPRRPSARPRPGRTSSPRAR